MGKKFDPIFRNIKKDKNYKINSFPDLKLNNENVSSCSNTISDIQFKKDPLSFKWKRGSEESKETIKEIEQKSKQIGISYNKGAYQYISKNDVLNLGKK